MLKNLQASFVFQKANLYQMDVLTFFTASVQGMSFKDVTLHVEHQLALHELDERGLDISVDLERCRIRGFFLEPQTIYPELV